MKKIFRLLLVLLIVPTLYGSAEATVKKNTSKVQKNIIESIKRSFSRGAYRDVISQVRVYEDLYPNGQHIEKASYFAGVGHYNLNNYAPAMDRLRSFVVAYPDSSLRYDAYLKLAFSYYSLNNWDEAILLSQKISAEDVDSARVLQFHLIAARSFVNMAKFKEAFSEYKAAFSVMEDKARLPIEKEVIELINKKVNWPNDLNVAIDLFGDSNIASYAMFKIGQVQLEDNDYVSAYVSLTQFVSNYPDHEYTDRARESIDNFSVRSNSRRIKIGAILPLSGERSDVGRKVMNGIQLAFADIDSSENIRLVVKDSFGDPDEAANLVGRMGRDRKIVGVIGPIFSDEVKEAVKVADRYRLPLLSPTAASVELTDISPYLFRNCLMMKNDARFMADIAVKKMGIRRFAILYQDDPQGIALRDFFSERLKISGGVLVKSVAFDKNESDFTKQIGSLGGISDKAILRMLSAGKTLPDYRYDAIYIAADANKIGLILPQLSFFNINDIPILGSSSTRSNDFIRVASDFSGEIIFPYSFDPNEQDHLTKDFVKKYQAYFNETPDLIAAQAFDAASILINLSRSGLRNKTELKRQLSNLKNFRGVTGLTSFNDSGDADKTFYLMKYRSKKFVVLTEEDIKALADKHTF